MGAAQLLVAVSRGPRAQGLGTLSTPLHPTAVWVPDETRLNFKRSMTHNYRFTIMKFIVDYAINFDRQGYIDF